MKKLLAVLTVAVLLVTICACGCKHVEVVDAAVEPTCTETGLSEGKHCSECNEVLVSQEEVAAKGHTEVVDEGKDATCTGTGLTEGKHCSVCDEVIVEQEIIDALGHTTDVGTCENCGLNMGIWETQFYVDEFDQPTDQWYVYNSSYLSGSFSNSATTDSKLYVTMLADFENKVSIFLYEYGRSQVKNISERNVETYSITMKTADGTKHELSGTMYCGGDRILIDDKHVGTVLNALKGEGTVSFYIVHDKYTSTNYLFSVDCSNFGIELAKHQ